MKALICHLKNKFINAVVTGTGHSISVVSRQGELLVYLVKDASGNYRCAQDHGAKYPFDLSPIPKDARYYKLHKDNKIAPCEEGQERKDCAYDYCKKYGYVPSESELKAMPKEA